MVQGRVRGLGEHSWCTCAAEMMSHSSIDCRDGQGHRYSKVITCMASSNMSNPDMLTDLPVEVPVNF